MLRALEVLVVVGSWPFWLAWARTLAVEDEDSARGAREYATAVVEYAVLTRLAHALARGASPAVEQALGAYMNEAAGYDRWARLLDALVEQTNEPGMNTVFLGEHPIGRAHGGPTDGRGFLRALGQRLPVGGDPGAPLVEALDALVGAMLDADPAIPQVVVAIREREGGGVEIHYRRPEGTDWPGLRTALRGERPAGLALGAVLWDGEGPMIPIPGWLFRIDPATLVARLYAGRAPNGQWTYTSRQPYTPPLSLDKAPDGMPAVLRVSREPTGSDPHETTWPGFGLLELMQRAQKATPMPVVRGQEGPLVLRVVAGRELMRYAVIRPGASLVIGRSHHHAQFLVHHAQVSRSHARLSCDAEGHVQVMDLGSSRGTQLDGKPVEQAFQPMHPGQILQIGPVLLRLERLSIEQFNRLERIIGFQGGENRDPLTGLLDSRFVLTGLPALLDRTPPPISAGLIDIDRLGALHARAGQDVADVVFQNAARLAMYKVPDPELCARMHYGRILVIFPGARIEDAERILGPALEAIEAHAWAGVLHGEDEAVSATAAVAEHIDGETGEAWAMRLAIALDQGRLSTSKARIHRAPELDLQPPPG